MKPTTAAATHQPTWLRFAIPTGWMLAIFLGSGQSRLPGPEGIPFFDKFAHFGAFGLLATLWLRAFAAGGRRTDRAALAALAVASIYGALDEFHQSFTPGRDVELADWVADTAGAALAVALYARWPAYRAVLEHRFVRRVGATPNLPVGTALAVETEHQP